MEDLGRPKKNRKQLLILGGILGFLLFAWFAHLRTRDQLPPLNTPDLSQNRHAGKIEYLTGGVFFRLATPEDLQRFGANGAWNPSFDSASGPQTDPLRARWNSLQVGNSFFLGTVFKVAANSSAQAMMAGDWVVVLNGEGEFLFEDARKADEKSEHIMSWMVQYGKFRAKYDQRQQGLYALEVKTPRARVLVQNGEIGVDVRPGKRPGRVWLMAGKGTVVWNDGRRLELPLKQVREL